MGSYVDYDFYVNAFMGSSIAQPVFDRLATRASRQIDSFTFGRAKEVVDAETDLGTIEKIKIATCAAAEEIQRLEESKGIVESEKVGDWSVTWANKGSEVTRVKNLVKEVLWDTGLMFGGLDA